MRFSIVIGVILGLTAPTTNAALLTWEFAGTIASVTDPFPFPVQVGDPIAFTLTWDDSVMDAFPDDPTDWYGYGALSHVTISAPGGSTSFSAWEGSRFDYWNDYDYFGVGPERLSDGFFVDADNRSSLPDPRIDLSFTLLNSAPELPGPWPAGNADPSLGLPDPADFLDDFFSYGRNPFLVRVPSTDAAISGTIASSRAVPLPTVGWLLAPAFGFLGWFKRRRSMT